MQGTVGDAEPARGPVQVLAFEVDGDLHGRIRRRLADLAQAHAEFQRLADRGREARVAPVRGWTAGGGPFVGRDVATYAPKIGDILQNNRAGNKFDFAFAASHSAYASHSAIVMEVGVDNKGRYLRTIGGNEGDAVGLKEVRLNSKGIVQNPGGLYISVVETLL